MLLWGEPEGRVCALQFERVCTCVCVSQLRWRCERDELLHQRATLFGDTLLASACLLLYQRLHPAQWGDAATRWRQLLVDHGIPVRDWFSLGRLVFPVQQICQWEAQGFLCDDATLDGAALLAHAVGPQPTVLIDPEVSCRVSCFCAF